MALTEDQRTYVLEQFLRKHDREPGVRTIPLDETRSLELEIDEGVLGSDLMVPAVILAKFLYRNRELYKNKKVLDVGCGAGPQGIICATNGAEYVDFSDINRTAVQNCRRNLERFGISEKVYEGDLFGSLPGNRYDIIIFNNPFFPGEPEDFVEDFPDDLILMKSLLGGTELLKRFYQASRRYLEEGGIIIQPHFDFAGEENNPLIQGPKNGYQVRETHYEQISVGPHKGKCSIYELR